MWNEQKNKELEGERLGTVTLKLVGGLSVIVLFNEDFFFNL